MSESSRDDKQRQSIEEMRKCVRESEKQLQTMKALLASLENTVDASKKKRRN